METGRSLARADVSHRDGPVLHASYSQEAEGKSEVTDERRHGDRRKAPAYQWYPGDWRRDTALQSCSLGARGLWIEMLNLMWDGTPRGYLRAGTRSIDASKLAHMVAAGFDEVVVLLKELEAADVFSRAPDGTIYSRRMVRDEAVRVSRANGGAESTRPDSKRSGAVGQLFNFLRERWGGCLWCQTKSLLELHRIVPGRKGGRYEPGNVLLLCDQHHRDMEGGGFGVPEVLAKHNLSSPHDLFCGFVHGRWPDAGKGMAKGSEKGTATVIPPAVAVASKTSTPRTPTVGDDWVPQFASAWRARFGGNTPWGRIGKALKDLRASYPDAEILARWERYLRETDGQFASPENFANKISEWAVKRKGLRDSYLTPEDMA